MVVLQKCMDLMKVVPGSYSETHPTSYDDIKVEEVTDIQEEEEDPLLTFPVIKEQHEVSCMSLSPLLATFMDMQNLFLSFSSPSVSLSASNTITVVNRF
jgi:hypothetical protein